MPIVSGALVPWMRYTVPPRYMARAPSGLPGPPASVARQIGLAGDHFRRRGPIRPLRLLGDGLGARPGEAVAADADAVAHRLAIAEHQVEIGVRGIDDDGAGRLAGRIGDDLAAEPGGQFNRAVFLLRLRHRLHRRLHRLGRRRQDEGEDRQRRGRGGSSRTATVPIASAPKAAAARRAFSLMELNIVDPCCLRPARQFRRVVGSNQYRRGVSGRLHEIAKMVSCR